jgi:hypothetical protein
VKKPRLRPEDWRLFVQRNTRRTWRHLRKKGGLFLHRQTGNGYNRRENGRNEDEEWFAVIKLREWIARMKKLRE